MSKKSGNIVETKNGLIGKIFNNSEIINNKIQVHTDNGNFLCDPKTLKIIGFFSASNNDCPF